jgi:hypothetical protein
MPEIYEKKISKKNNHKNKKAYQINDKLYFEINKSPYVRATRQLRCYFNSTIE